MSKRKRLPCMHLLAQMQGSRLLKITLKLYQTLLKRTMLPKKKCMHCSEK